eukprot:TRINITY_DN8559_c0_g1_i1.p1 TRINITY_DN8559_c0_g1~~TRINITY_DN8559_c0_g1_i1.p1  ORF type:complete len:174 (-),score=34.20 TRINITY_DN8559_c0_g1_i1:99-620(-)
MRLPHHHVWYYIHQIAEGLFYLHQQNIVHSNLRSSNVLFDGVTEPFAIVKLTDFIQNSSLDKRLNWLSPEVLKGEKDSPSSDVWSMGMLILELLTLKKPYHELAKDKIEENIKEGKLPIVTPNAQEESAYTLFKKCCALNPLERPNAKEILTVCLDNMPRSTASNLQRPSSTF